MSDPRQDAGAPAVPSSPETEAWSDSNPGSPSPSTSIARASVPEPPSAFATVYPPGTLGLAAGPVPNVPGFEILSELGHGGMGVVYKARHLKLNRLVALKMIRPGLHSGAEALARFRVEAEAVARLQHPGIVQIFEIGEYEGSPFFAMELVAGVSLDKLIAGDPVPARPAAALVHRLAEAIQAAHEKNVIHRDLKPANILLQESGARGQESEVRSQKSSRTEQTAADARRLSLDLRTPKIADFGLAKRLDVDVGQTQSGAILGTPNYMAPEQAAGDTKAIGTASDVYALGAILYELLTGRPPFKAASLADTLRQVREEDPVPPSRLEPTVPRDLQTICLKCLRKSPAQRYSSAADLAGDLRRFLAGEPIRARPVGNAERLWRWCRKHPVVSVSSALALVAIVAGLAIWQSGENRRLDEEGRRVTEQQRRQQAEWRERQEAAAHRDKQRLAGEADEQLAVAELRGGRLESALKIMQTALARLPDEPAFAPLRAGLDARQQRIARLVQFHQLSTEAEEAVAERFRTREGDVEALTKCKTALEALGVFEHAEWWEHLPDQDLSEPQRRQLQGDAYRELHLLAALQCKSGIPDFHGGPAGNAGLKDSLDTIAMINRHRPSYSASLVEMFCYFSLGQVGKVRPLAGKQPDNAADAHFTGLLYVWLSFGYADNISTLAKTGSIILGLDTNNPAAAGERYLRIAANLEPGQYWTNYWLGEALVMNGKPGEAELAFNQCVALRPGYGVGFGGRDQALRMQYRRADSAAVKKAILQRRMTNLAEAIAHNPRPEFYLARGYAHVDNKNPDAAMADFDTAIKSVPKRGPLAAELYYQRALLWLAKKAPDNALADLDETIRLDPKAPLSYFHRGAIWSDKGDYQRAILDFDEVIRLSPREAAAFARRGFAWHNSNNLDKALDDYNEALRLNPKDIWTLNQRGLAWLDKKQNEKAIEDFDQVIQVDAKSPAVHYSRGLAWADQGQPDLAIADFTAALTLDPNYIWALRSRGKAWLAKKEYDKAIADFTAALGIDANDVGALADRALAWLAGGNPDKAIADFDELLRRDPRSVWTYNNRGRAWGSKKDYPRALADFTEAIRLDSKAYGAYSNRAATYSIMKEYRKAIDDYDEVIRLNPASSQAYNAQAWLLATCCDAACRDGKKAVTLAKRALELDKKSASILDTLAAAHAEAGEFDEAVRVQEQALQDPRLAKDEQARARLKLYRQKTPYRVE